MEQNNLPVIAKRLWSIMRVVYFMLRKGISKGKLMVDLNLMMKRGKIAGKAISNLMFHLHHHHHHHHHNSSSSTSSNRRSIDRHHLSSFNAPLDYEFSCDNSPAFPFQLTKRSRNHHHFFACAHPPATQDDDVITVNAVKKVLEMLNANDQIMAVEASPALPGFGKSPAMVRQLRVTDSPFPLNNVNDDHRVDEAAEEFIAKFYKELKKQNIMGSPSPW